MTNDLGYISTRENVLTFLNLGIPTAPASNMSMIFCRPFLVQFTSFLNINDH